MHNPFPSIRLANALLRIPVEGLVSQYTGRTWTVSDAQDLADLACHPAAILSDGSYSVFAKFSEAEDGREQFEVELAGLRLLSTRSGVLIPTPIGILSVPDGSVLVLEAVEVIERGPRQWQEIGRALARIHQVKGERFGLETHGYFGPLPQDNTPGDDWPAFYAEQRLQPMLRMAIDSGNLPADLVPRLERLIARLPKLCGPPITPTLIHGDAQQNNFISSEHGAVVIDPAAHFGHPEMDLAFLDYFQPVPEVVFDAYREQLPIDPGFWERRHLWRIYGYLAAVTVEGAGYLNRLTQAIRKYE